MGGGWVDVWRMYGVRSGSFAVRCGRCSSLGSMIVYDCSKACGALFPPACLRNMGEHGTGKRDGSSAVWMDGFVGRAGCG